MDIIILLRYDYILQDFFILDRLILSGDFNNDGLEDMVIAGHTFPHTIERESRYSYSILINNGDGSMTYDHDAFYQFLISK